MAGATIVSNPYEGIYRWFEPGRFLDPSRSAGTYDLSQFIEQGLGRFPGVFMVNGIQKASRLFG